MYIRSINPFSQLFTNSEDEFEKPEIHPVAKLIKYRFSHRYDGKLTLNELDKLKQNMIAAKNRFINYKLEVHYELSLYYNLKREQKSLCYQDNCQAILQNHLDICSKCTKNFVGYECLRNYENNGRCSHYYKLDNIEQDICYIEESIDYYNGKYIDIQIEYERALAVKEDRLKEYERQMEDDWDDYNFEISQNIL